MDKKIKKLQSQTRKLERSEKDLLKTDQKNDRKLDKAKKVLGKKRPMC